MRVGIDTNIAAMAPLMMMYSGAALPSTCLIIQSMNAALLHRPACLLGSCARLERRRFLPLLSTFVGYRSSMKY
jgi:hypothetical protein